MIKANELRIGNKVFANGLHGGKILTFHRLQEEGQTIFFNEHHTGEYLSDCEGIPLTPEILQKAGFNMLDRWAEKNEFILLKIGGSYTYHYSTLSDKRAIVKYVHQLQNLYFALTGEELNINL